MNKVACPLFLEPVSLMVVSAARQPHMLRIAPVIKAAILARLSPGADVAATHAVVAIGSQICFASV